MMESLYNANEELKRVEHLVYVSLKYTRTVDVIKSVVDRLIASLDYIIEALFEYLKEKKKLKEVPKAPVERAENIKQLFKEDITITELMDFYLLLRKISRAKYKKREEYRRHVTMIATLDEGKTFDVTTDLLKEYYIKMKDIIEYIGQLIAK